MPLVTNRKVKFFCVDITDQAAVREVFHQERPWAVVHLAAPVSVNESKQHPDKYLRNIVTGTLNVVSEASGAGARRLIYTNSAATYGMAKVIPTPETYPASPTNPYGAAKYLGEQIAIHWGRTLGVETISLRLANLYGEFASALFGLFTHQWLTGQPLTVTGDGSQLRDFTNVQDVAKGVRHFIESSLSYEILNFGTGQPISVIQMASYFNSQIRFINRSSDEPHQISLSIERLKSELPIAVPTSKAAEEVPRLLQQLRTQ